MRTATPKTYAVNNKANEIVIEGYGTTSFKGFAQVLFNAGKIDYKLFMSATKNVFSQSLCEKLVNENPELFPACF